MIEIVLAVLSLLATIAAAASSLAAWRAVKLASRRVEAAERATEAAVFMRIDQRWQDVYSTYRRLVTEQPDMELLRKYEDRNEFMRTDYWQERRELFAFYEFIGSCIDTNLLREATVFRLVNVNVAVWDRFKPMIYAMREMKPGSYPDLYFQWERLSERRRGFKIEQQKASTL